MWQDVDENNCYRYPKLYVASQQNKNFNVLIFLRSILKGIYVAFVFFFILFGMTFLNTYGEGYEWDYQSFGVAASGALILIVNLQVSEGDRNCLWHNLLDKCCINELLKLPFCVSV